MGIIVLGWLVSIANIVLKIPDLDTYFSRSCDHVSVLKVNHIDVVKESTKSLTSKMQYLNQKNNWTRTWLNETKVMNLKFIT